MAGIYIHIPFCKQACTYCNFHFSTSLKQKNDLVAALLREINLTPHFNDQPPIETIYFGGGSPSILHPDELLRIMEALHNKFAVMAEAEITLEANPDDIDTFSLTSWKQAGINRLSIGIQSFQERDLQWMHRAHSAHQAADSIVLAQAAGFHNISADLIYGVPGLSDSKWQENVQKLISLAVPHISCYALTVEPSTALHHQINKKQRADVDPEHQAAQFLMLMDWLTQNGYEHYEISNFSLPGKRSKHNSAYWKNSPYYGLGPSAHSFDGKDIRYWNIANNSLYIQSLQKDIIPVEKEALTTIQKVNEYIMTSLRTAEGISLQYLSTRFNPSIASNILQAANAYPPDKLIVQDEFLRLTREGKLFADGIAAGLFQDEH